MTGRKKISKNKTYTAYAQDKHKTKHCWNKNVANYFLHHTTQQLSERLKGFRQLDPSCMS